VSKQQPLGLDTETRKVTRLREVPLSVVEFGELGKEAGNLARERDEHKKNAKEKAEKVEDLLAQIDKGTVSRDVECELRIFHITRTVQVWDGEEMIEERAIEDGEFQVDMPFLQHGVVMDPEVGEVIDADYTEMTDEEKHEDIKDVMKAEKSKTKPSLVDL
jgi:hypothetical protein